MCAPDQPAPQSNHRIKESCVGGQRHSRAWCFEIGGETFGVVGTSENTKDIRKKFVMRKSISLKFGGIGSQHRRVDIRSSIWVAQKRNHILPTPAVEEMQVGHVGRRDRRRTLPQLECRLGNEENLCPSLYSPE